ncbi:MAG: hypothetical protein KJZ78_16700, partial [Bryobacteraceae bacterium]|nr:hypothetical protein [Bryobacteraceae bacterium]
DFAAGLAGGGADAARKPTHTPVAVLTGPTTKRVLEIETKSGETVRLSAEGTRDPDGDAIEVGWWIYREASTLRDAKGRRFPEDLALGATRGTVTSLVAPAVKEPATVHVILEVKDGGTPSLFAYRRAVITVSP